MCEKISLEYRFLRSLGLYIPNILNWIKSPPLFLVCTSSRILGPIICPDKWGLKPNLIWFLKYTFLLFQVSWKLCHLLWTQLYVLLLSTLRKKGLRMSWMLWRWPGQCQPLLTCWHEWQGQKRKSREFWERPDGLEVWWYWLPWRPMEKSTVQNTRSCSSKAWPGLGW